MRHKKHLAILTLGALVLISTQTQGSEDKVFPEPDVKVASQWWPEMRNVWTPVGWKNHLFRFTILHSGIIIAEPDPKVPFGKRHTSGFAGLGAQVTITPTADEITENGDASKVLLPASLTRSEPYQLKDMNANLFGHQGWSDHPTPVLWSEWSQPHISLNGITLKEEVFGHIPGGADVKTGTEPLFGWIRISIADKLEMIQRGKVGFRIRVNAPHVTFSMWASENVIMHPAQSAYPRKLSVEMIGETNHPGCVLVEDGGKVRLALLPGKADS